MDSQRREVAHVPSPNHSHPIAGVRRRRIYGYRSGYYGQRGFGGLIGLLVIVLLLLYFFGGIGSGLRHM